jgi:cardiolipin synthase
MEYATWISSLVLVVDLLVRLGLSFRIIMRRRPVGVTFAWLTILLILPLAGAIVYLTFGELRLGNRRAEWAKKIHGPYQQWLADVQQRHPQVDWSALGVECEPLARLAQSVFDAPPLPESKLQLLPDWEHAFRSLIADIDAAERTCHLVFYIWNSGGLADEVMQAVIRAARRGVVCRVLLDDVGSRPFLRSDQARVLREAGVRLHRALPVGLVRMLFVRLDLRMHRKIVVIDGEVAYTGSLNLVDPRYFKQEAHVGQWVDAMVRVTGPAVEGLAITFLEDWELETSEGLEQLRQTGDVHDLPPAGQSVVQAIPSGPAFEAQAVQDVLLMTIYAARHKLVLTSPYFVPDESLATALATAARRGVEVTLIVPARVDSFLVRYASQAFKGDLLQAGVKIAQFDGGLLHTKSVTVDDEFCLFGSLNLDARSLHLNFEITLAIYDRQFSTELADLQHSYLAHSTWMNLAEWQSRPLHIRLKENALRLLSPLL